MRDVLAAAATVLALSAAPAAAQTWAPASSATIHPGVQTFTEGAQCTANFVMTDQDLNVYIGQAAHCSGTGAATDTNGCTAKSLPNGTPVEVDGASRPGTMVYNSWLAMQAAGEKDEEVCYGNDFAIIALDPADFGKVNPSVPFWGGPVGIGSGSTGEFTYSYGNSGLRFGLSPLSPKTGVITMTSAKGWEINVYTASPGVPGDSGSAFLNAGGAAMGVLSTLEAAPRPASNNVSSFGLALRYAQAHGAPAGIALANGTEPFEGL